MLIGYTGFVGSNLIKQIEFDYLVNSKNIIQFSGVEVEELIICAGDARKWLANKEPENDLKHITKLYDDISKIKAKKVVLFSTVDVYDNKKNVYEGSFKVSSQPYGKHRRQFEQLILGCYDEVKVIRLPGLFGNGLKKNIIFDIIMGKDITGFNPNSTFQWFHLDELKKVIDYCKSNGIEELNVTSEPITVAELCNRTNVNLGLLDENAPLVKYDICSKHGIKYSSNSDYLYNKIDTLDKVAHYIECSRT